MEKNDQEYPSEDNIDQNKQLKKISTSGEGMDPQDDSALHQENDASDPEEFFNEKPIEDLFIENHHPTGDPESTAGWFAEEIGNFSSKPNPVSLDMSTNENENLENTKPSPIQPGSNGEDTTRPSVPPFTLNKTQDQSSTRRSVSSNTVNPNSYQTPPGATQPILPRQVNQFDTQATKVSPAAYQNRSTNQNQVTRPNIATPSVKSPRASKKKTSGYENNEKIGGWGCLIRSIITILFLIVLVFLVAGSFGVYQYFRIASGLPSVDNLEARAANFETTRILDRNGNVIYEILDPNAGRRTYVPLEKISPYLIAATLATEDKEYYNHPGFDPIAVARAFVQNYTAGEIVSGASTITQQVARMLLLDDTERYTKTYERKAREIVLAAEITRKYSKEKILEIFLNENNYGNLAYGIEAAAETYFNTSAESLTLAQASFLAGLPQAPAIYDVYTNREATLNRHKQVLVLLYTLSQEKNCIYVSTNLSDVCVNEIANAAQEMEKFNFQQRDYSMRYPHWVNYIRTQLESQFDPQTIYRSGFTVYTTLDPSIQESAEQIVKNQISQLQDYNASSGAVIVMRPTSGEILAMVGSSDFYNEVISGQVNMALSPRQPGSSIKPLVYLAAFEKGWNPATLIWDIPTEFSPSGDPNDPSEKYRPVNYDGRFHGPVTVRYALANSYNIPAVKALQYVGIYDNPNTSEPDGFINFTKRLGISTLTREDYGLSVALGGGDVTLLEMTNAFATLANNGHQIPPVAITKIVDYLGNVVYEYQKPEGTQVVRAEYAYLISSILSDKQARSAMFGQNSILNLPFQVAAKTGTTNDFRDNWTIGYTPDVSIGVWVGNADYTPMVNTTGLTGAAPIWAELMQIAEAQITGNNPTSFSRPGGIVDRVICSTSGTEPSEWCTDQRNEMFTNDRLPKPKEDDFWKKANIDTWTGLRASAACSEFTKDEFVINISDPEALRWIKDDSQGRDWAASIGFESPIQFIPDRECRIDDPHPKIIFSTMSDNQVITTNPVDIYAVIKVEENFDRFVLDYGMGNDPREWTTLKESDRMILEVELIYSWDLFEKEIEQGDITLRIKMYSKDDGKYAEKRIHIRLNASTPTPTSTPTFTLTPTFTVTPTFTLTPLPTATSTSTPTLPPTSTFTPSPTPTLTATPSPTTPVPATDLSATLTSTVISPSETATLTPTVSETPTITVTP
ncbi:MAG: hypothetical protein CVU46_08735 [Chloroflexi bacterium HGW-Chloroflexi-8]|nr:MAG: hypothetical protein CVU46_08735 [Chloroflexi bacterium HGW-Chloroflexi-8]